MSTGWVTDAMVAWAEAGFLKRQPDIEPGSHYCPPTTSIFDCMASPPAAGVIAAQETEK